MTEKTVSLDVQNNIAIISMDDNKNNVVSPYLIQQINACLDQAEREGAVVILTGRDGIFSAGFDLGILRTGVINTFKMLVGGFRLAKRLYGFPNPVIIACNGHAIAMGVFLLLCADYRIGVRGRYRIVANEVAIGLTMPFSAVEICRQRLSPSDFQKAVNLSHEYNPETAMEAGFIDKLVDSDELLKSAKEKAQAYTQLNLDAHKASKRRSRRTAMRKIGCAIHKDTFDFILQGLKRIISK